MVKKRPSPRCVPRWQTPRSPSRRSLGPAVAAAAESLGLPLMPWQRLVADVGLELLDDGTPAYRDVIFTVPRQNGKTTLVLSWEVQRALHWAEILGVAQRIAYTAQTGSDARKKLVDDQFPLLEPRKKALGIRTLRRAIGSESVDWLNGSKLVVHASSEDAGHGGTLDLGVQDELFHDADWRRDQAMGPSMITRPHAQKLKTSTAGTADSVVWNDTIALGRATVEAGRTTGVAFFEWSAASDDDPGDPRTWWSCMPALGRTIGLPVIEHEYETLKLDEFKRAYLNIPTKSDQRVIPRTVWDLVCTPDVEATAAVFAVDVNPERSAAGIVAAGPGPILEVVDYRAGVGWLVERCVELHDRYGCPIALDGSAPAASFVPDLERARVPLTILKPQEMPRAAGMFFDRVVGQQVQVRRHDDLDQSVDGADKRIVGDAWTWGRKNSRTDISLLVAATVALWCVAQPDTGESAPIVMVLGGKNA